jgi:hypothetical protein
MSAAAGPDAQSAAPAWQLERRYVEANGIRYLLRLVRFDTGWMASVDTPTGPTLGVDRSPYLATARAVEPIGVRLEQAMTLIGPMTHR